MESVLVQDLLATIFQGIIYGLSLGMLYALVAVGLTLIFGMMDIVNFSHGAFVTLGAFIAVSVIAVTENFWLALAVGVAVLVVLGMGIERVLIRQIYGENLALQLLLTFGIALVIEGAIILYYGQQPRGIDAPPLLAGDPLTFGGIVLPKYRLFIIVLTIVLFAILWWIFEHSNLGLIVKAGIEDRERTELLGINISRMSMLIFGVGAGLAALAGALAAPILGITVDLGLNLLIISFAVIIIGGLGNIQGTVITALGIGILYTQMLLFAGNLANISIFVAMVLVLLVKPKGLFEGISQ